MILPYTIRAASHVDALVTHYLEKDRPEAVRSLMRTLAIASAAILDGSAARYDTPRPYPTVREVGAYWVHFPPYWIAYRRPASPVISAVFYDAADIPGRI